MEEMENQILTLEKSIHKLKNEIDGLTDIIMRFDKEINRQFRLINKIKDYCLKTNMTVEEYEKLIEMISEDEKNVK